MAQIHTGGAVSGVADVDADSQLKVVTNPDPEKAGAVRMFSENDPGDIVGTPDCTSPETSHDYRLRVGLDSFLDIETFNYSSQNTTKHSYTNTTMTMALSSGFLVTNSGSITTTTTGVKFLTHRFFPLFGQQSPLYVETSVALLASLSGSTNTTIDFGVGLLGAANPYAPTDGVYFRMTSAGVSGVINYNGVETTTSVFTFTPATGQVYQYLVTITEREVEFWIDDMLYARLTTPVGNGQPMMASSGQWFVRHAIAGGAAGNTQQIKISDMSVQLGDLSSDKPWGHQLSGMGQCGYQGQSGGTLGTTANYANSSNPSTAAGSNTAANVTGLGGQGAINAAGSAATDFIATSYQNPAGTVSSPGRMLYICGVTISTANLGATVATTPTCVAWSLAFGHTAVSMATAETASFASGTTKAPRRIALGFQNAAVGAVAGTVYSPGQLIVRFDGAPIPVAPGEFIATVLKQIVGTATGSQSVWFHVTFDAYWE